MFQKGYDQEKQDNVDKSRDMQTELTGEFGPWQGLIFTILALTIVIHGWQMMANKFLTYPIDHWGESPKNHQNISVEGWLNISSPILSDGSHDRCNMFDIDYGNPELNRPSEDTSKIACTKWEYDENTFQVQFYAHKYVHTKPCIICLLYTSPSPRD